MPTKSEREAAEARNAKTLTKEEYDHLTAEQRTKWVLNAATGEYAQKPGVAHDSQAEIDQSRTEREARRSQ